MVTNASYDLAGNLTGLTYPDGRLVQQTFDSAGRLLTSNLVSLNGVDAAESYLQGMSYFPDGSPSLMTLGNGVQQRITKNNRLQTQSNLVTNPVPLLTFGGTETYLSRQYCYANCGSGGVANNGNIWEIDDNLQGPHRSQQFTYDSLNRIKNVSLATTNDWSVFQQYEYDSFGNITTVGTGVPANTYDPATNRISNLACGSVISAYDAAGNQLCMTDQFGAISQLAIDAENRIGSMTALNGGSPYVSYTYGAEGDRVFKQNADGTYTVYASFGGHVIAEQDDAGQWTDYIFANGSRIARLRAEDQWLFVSGTQTATPANYFWTMPTPNNPGTGGPYVVKSGDQLCLRQNNSNLLVGGPFVTFSNGVGTDATWVASDGYPLNGLVGSYPNVWSNRCVDLTGGGAATGASISSLGVESTSATPANYTGWELFLADMTNVSQDGTATPITLAATGGPQGNGYFAVTALPWLQYQQADTQIESTHYFISDHLGTAQLELSEGGWPVYAGQFAPYGQEIQPNGTLLPTDAPDGSTNHYKFTGKERDTESGLDYFGARYYASNMGRFQSPDWAGHPEAVPYSSLKNPQTLNLYAYVGNNPMTGVDPDGHAPLDCTGSNASGIGCQTIAQWNTQHEVSASAWASSGFGNVDVSYQNGNYTVQQSQTPTANQNTDYASVSYWPKGAGGFGHIGIGIDTDDTQGYSTADPKVPWYKRLFGAPAGGTEDDIAAHTKNGEVAPHGYLHIPITADQAAAMQAAMEARRTDPGHYNLFLNNCAQFVESVLHAGGVSGVPHGEVFGPAILGGMLWLGQH
jgi:RHS repeat-associated protein